MTATTFSLIYTNSDIERILDAGEWQEIRADNGNEYMTLQSVDGNGSSAGYVRLWRAPDALALDRMIHMRLVAGPVETQLLFVFGITTSTMPHMHAQIV